jgi:hypothetical protein
MLKINTKYACYQAGVYLGEYEIEGAVGEVAIAVIDGNYINFDRQSGKGLDNPEIELRKTLDN